MSLVVVENRVSGIGAAVRASGRELWVLTRRALISERKRRESEIDRFHWYCQKCDALLHEETFTVTDYGEDPVSKAYARFFGSKEFRTCNCGEVMPAPEGL